MHSIEVRRPTEEELQDLGVRDWPLWEKGESRFPWTYDEQEVCYLIAGRVTVEPETGAPVTFGEGDLVTLPRGMRCTWDIHEAVRKHYRLGEE
ncbi:cupin domain-containing protein [Thiohalorhabdus sp. Cl-TMA]|uniref:Cupin domain-containing protein n=1 Tax=Thiohalorhabdus methylotrophus TaxID=3242694 RepID=A0ABV4TVH0_9GAMM